MPYVRVACPSGTHEFFYSISTPTESSALRIDLSRPTVLCIHSSYSASEGFECQYDDPELRRFNLVSIDSLGHGSTRGMIGDQTYTPTETARDLKLVMDALSLPPCHVFGVSLGGTVALELATAHPSQVLSLTICSPLTPTELEDVADGRQQVFDHWVDVFGTGMPHSAVDGGEESPEESEARAERTRLQEELLGETLHGVLQLAYNNEDTVLTKALGRFGMVRAIEVWGGTEAKMLQGLNGSVYWFTKRRPIAREAMAKLDCPVAVISCTEDVAYPYEVGQELAESIRASSKAKVTLHKVKGPHYAHALNPAGVNAILRDSVLSVECTRSSSSDVPDLSTLSLSSPDDSDSDEEEEASYNPQLTAFADAHWPAPSPQFPVSGRMKTPWTDILRRFGYDPTLRSSQLPQDTLDRSGASTPTSAGSSSDFEFPGSWFAIPRPIVPDQRHLSEA